MTDSQYPRAHQFAATYYVILSIVATLLMQSALYAIGAKGLLPFFKTFLLAVITAGIFGALFAKPILSTGDNQKFKTWLMGFLMVLCAMPFYNLGLLLILPSRHPELLEVGHGMQHYALLYGFISIYSFLLAGLWLAILSGFAAIYLRYKFYPDYLKFYNSPERQEISTQSKDE